jgi:hypothetical protein
MRVINLVKSCFASLDNRVGGRPAGGVEQGRSDALVDLGGQNRRSRREEERQNRRTRRQEEDRRAGKLSAGLAISICILASFLLILTLQNMIQVTYAHPADGPHEMMIYVQTDPDVNTVMAKIDALDQKLYGGRHQLSIGLMDDATWPFAWYLRDYNNLCLSFPTGCGDRAKNVQVIITAGEQIENARTKYAAGQHPSFLLQQYRMRNWWDEGYKPPPCAPSPTDNCADSPKWGGVGAGLWLSYGDNPPPNAQPNLALAAQHIWQWWWQRQPFGGTGGVYNMALLIRQDLGAAP